MSSVMIRVDPEVYDTVMARKHEMEREYGRMVSMNEAIYDLLHLEYPPYREEGVVDGKGR